MIRPRNLLCLATAILSLLAPTAMAQMTTGKAMEDFGKTFNLSAKGWSVQQIGCSQDANILWPGDVATFGETAEILLEVPDHVMVLEVQPLAGIKSF